jgi:hypothetical protein
MMASEDKEAMEAMKNGGFQPQRWGFNHEHLGILPVKIEFFILYIYVYTIFFKWNWELSWKMKGIYPPICGYLEKNKWGSESLHFGVANYWTKRYGSPFLVLMKLIKS